MGSFHFYHINLDFDLKLVRPQKRDTNKYYNTENVFLYQADCNRRCWNLPLSTLNRLHTKHKLIYAKVAKMNIMDFVLK